ncbi:hypothetical protein CRYUN_Cryun23aG0054300 [Craigia yunnanensis]
MIILQLLFVVLALLLLLILANFKDGLPSVNIYKNKLNFLHYVRLEVPQGLLLLLVFFLIMTYGLSPISLITSL